MMKKTILIFIVFAFLANLSACFAQLQVNAGNDTTFCIECFSKGKPPQLGTGLTVTGGVPPYRYAWSAEINMYGSVFYAKDFLSNTTISSPIFIDYWHDQHWVPFTLTVTDAKENTATDVINIRFSILETTMVWQEYYQNIGDEIILKNVNTYFGGIRPFRSYAWSPTDGLLTPNEETTVCKVTIETVYSLTVEDSAGCKSTFDVCRVNILPSGETVETKYTDNNIPYIQDGVLFWKNADMLPVKITLYSFSGIKIREVYPVANKYFLKNDMTVPVLYEIVIGSKRYVGKYIFNQVKK